MQELPPIAGSVRCGPSDPVEALKEQQDLLRERADELDEIEPPAEIERTHERLIEAHSTTADRLDPLIDKVKDIGSIEEAETAEERTEIFQQQFELSRREFPTGREFGRAVQEFEAAGYEVDPRPLSRGDYEERANEALEGLERITLEQSGDAEAVRAEAAELGGRMAAAAEELDDLTPPEEVEDDHRDLVSGLCRRGRQLEDLDRFAPEGQDIDAEVILQALKLQDPLLDNAREGFDAAGFRVNVPTVDA